MASLHLPSIVGLVLIQSLVFVTSEVAPLTKLSGKDITSEVFGNTERRGKVFPVAYGDFNSDKLTDMITVTYNMSTIIIYLGYEEAPLLRKAISCDIEANNNGSVHIVGIGLGDFTGDGLMDVVVSFVHPLRETLTRVIVFQGTGNDLICSSGSTNDESNYPIDMVQEPLILDLNGDMIMDLLGEVWIKAKDKNDTEERSIWIFELADDKPTYKKQKFIVDDHSTKLRPMVNSSSNAYVDVDGDMIPELVIMTNDGNKSDHSKTRYLLEYYRVHKDDKENIFFSIAKRPLVLDPVNQTQIYGQPIFMDLNQDGRLFHLLPFCTNRKCSEGLQGLKAIYDGTVTTLTLGFKDKWSFFHANKHYHGWDTHYSRTIILRAGDYNLDGYPDLIGVVKLAKKQVSETQAVIFENVPCLPDESGKPCNTSRTFRINYDVLQQYSSVALATFYDIFEDGLIDIIIVRRANNVTASHNEFEVRAFQNSPDYDANFMKVMVLSGRKCLKCPKSGIPYGNIIPGPIISYKTTTQAGNPQVAVAAQFYRSSHMTMDLPCTIFGIGHSPNFVETLHVHIGYSASTSNATHIWPQIIPNSQIIVVPSPLDSPKQWKAKLFLTPSKAVLNTFGVLVGFCLFVTSLVLALQYKERREDRKEKLNEARQFHMM